MRRVRFSPLLVILIGLGSVAFAQSKSETPSAADLVNRGVEVAKTGEYDAAIHNFDEAIRIDPKYGPAYDNRGTAEMAKGDFTRAIADYDEAIRLNPKDAVAFSDRGLAYKAKGDLDRAIADYDQALKIDPQFALVYYGRGLVYGKKGDDHRAVADFEEAIRLNPENPSAYNSAAWILATCSADKCRDGTKAVEFATKACSLTGWKDPDFLDTLGVAYAEIGDFDQAIRFEKEALRSRKWAEKEGEGAEKRLDLYKERKPYHEKTP